MMKTLMSNSKEMSLCLLKRNISLSTLYRYLRLFKYLFFKMLKITLFLRELMFITHSGLIYLLGINTYI